MVTQPSTLTNKLISNNTAEEEVKFNSQYLSEDHPEAMQDSLLQEVNETAKQYPTKMA
jgi:predicted Zn-dependent peptidase